MARREPILGPVPENKGTPKVLKRHQQALDRVLTEIRGIHPAGQVQILAEALQEVGMRILA